MSIWRSDGGPAFPHQYQFNRGEPATNITGGGMSLRDYFAGQALAGICANPEWRPTDPDTMAQDAYLHADAMLAERQKGGAQ